MYNNVYEIEEKNKAAGYHFFDEDTMRFFKSRIHDGVWGGKYFITSERRDDHPRRFTIRCANEDGSIDTCGDFSEFITKADAVRYIKTCILPNEEAEVKNV